MTEASNKDLEKQKLQLEIKELRKPAIRKLGTWFNIFAALIAVSGIIGQSILSNIKVERALFDADKKTADAALRIDAAALREEAAQIEVQFAEREADDLRFETLALSKQKLAFVAQIDAAKETLDMVQQTADAIKESGASSELVTELDRLITDTSSSLSYRCTRQEIAVYNDALLINAQEAELSRRHNLPWGLPKATIEIDGVPLDQVWWVGLYDTSLKVPRWTGHRLDAADTPPVRRRDCFRRDPRFVDGQVATADDFFGPEFDRGHLVPRSDMSTSELAQASTYIYTNIAPQAPALNRYPWVSLERRGRDWANEFAVVYVITGVIFDHDGDQQPDQIADIRRIGANGVGVPSHLFKIFARSDDLSDAPEVIAFVMRNDDDADQYRNNLSLALVSVDDVEQMTGLDFFPNLPASFEIREQTVASVLWGDGNN